jgi:two-component system, NarL family, response regulator DevR
VRVVVAHRHELLAEALGRLLEDFGLVAVGLASDPAALLDRLPRTSADVLLLDAGFDPRAGPLVALEHIRAAAPGLRIVVLAQALGETLDVAARDGDLDAVVLTGTAGVALTAAIAQVAAGHSVFPAEWLRNVHRGRPTRSYG